MLVELGVSLLILYSVLLFQIIIMWMYPYRHTSVHNIYFHNYLYNYLGNEIQNTSQFNCKRKNSALSKTVTALTQMTEKS